MARLPGKVILLRKSVVMAVLAIAAACAIFGAVALPAAITTTAAARQLPIYSVERAEGEKLCAISFDAAWGNEDTQKLIDILAEYSDHHDHYNTLSREQIVADINASCQKIEAVTGSRPTLIRCPYGEYDDHVISAVRSLGMEPIQWDVDSLDWKDYDADTIFRRVTEHVAPGSIVLFHNAALHTPEALPSILQYLQGQGYTVVPIGQRIYREGYTIDHTGRQFLAESGEQQPEGEA